MCSYQTEISIQKKISNFNKNEKLNILQREMIAVIQLATYSFGSNYQKNKNCFVVIRLNRGSIQNKKDTPFLLHKDSFLYFQKLNPLKNSSSIKIFKIA